MGPAIEDGSQVTIHYTLTVDGEVVDSSEGGDPLSYTQGRGQLIPGLESELVGSRKGDKKEVDVSPENGYGPVNPEGFVEVSKDRLAPGVTPEVGMTLGLPGKDGQSIPVRVHAVGDDTVTLDLNHPLAGKTLHFSIQVVDVAS